jgi:hypothetical protein
MAECKQIKNILDLRFVELCTFGFPFATMPTRHHSSPKRYWTRARDGVMLSNTAEEIRACIPFGAAHRVNLDSPPLKGNCPDTLVSRQIPRKHGMEITMGDVQTMRDRPKEKLRGRDRRSLNLSTKLTAAGKRHREKVRRKSDAIKLYQSRKADVVAGRKLPELRNSKVVTLSELIDDVLEFVAHHQDNRSYTSKGEIVRKALGSKPAADLTPQELERWLRTRCKTPATANRYKGLHFTLLSRGCSQRQSDR